MISEKTLIPIGMVGMIVGGAIAWGSIRFEVTDASNRIERQEQAIKEIRESGYARQNELMAQLMILRQDVSEIKGELKNRK